MGLVIILEPELLQHVQDISQRPDASHAAAGMGAECSTVLARPPAICQPQMAVVTAACGVDTCGGGDCSPCDNEHPSGLALDARPLLLDDGGSPRPSTPRGPAPPWAVSASMHSRTSPIDRTSTGATPPRMLQPCRQPPGLPEDRLEESNPNLSLGAPFMQELAQAARTGSTAVLGPLLQRVYSEGHRVLYGASSGGVLAAEKCEKVDDLVAAFVSSVCDPATGETLLSAAAANGHHETVEYLLGARADPLVLDKRGDSALHAAAEGGSAVAVFLILDRLQGQNRSIALSEITTTKNETPDVLASRAGASEAARALSLFESMQAEAKQRNLGHCKSVSGENDQGAPCALTLIDLMSDVQSKSGLMASALLRRTVAGTGLVQGIFRRVPESELELREVIEHACCGIRGAEGRLLSSDWVAEAEWQPGLGAAVRHFAGVAQIRSSWQKMRAEAVQAAGCADVLKDFWQTHITADSMVATLQRVRGDTFQLLLIILWLYTREAWLPHVLDALAGMTFLASPWHDRANTESVDGTTGATPLRSPLLSDSSPIGRTCMFLIDSLAPCAQLVQSALNYFEERGIRHEGETYRPLQLSAHALQVLAERVAAVTAGKRASPDQGEDGIARSRGEDTAGQSAWPWTAGALGGDVWLSLGANSFFSSQSSRPEAAQRLLRMRCNVLLVIRPDASRPCYPKHLSLRCSGVDDVLFPLGVLFRVVRLLRTSSAELVPDAGSSSQWPVVVLELECADRALETMEVLELRSELRPGELESLLDEWVAGAAPACRHVRLLSAGELLARCASSGDQRLPALELGAPHGDSSGCQSAHGQTEGKQATRMDRALAKLAQAASLAEVVGDTLLLARALLARAQICASTSRTQELSASAAADAKKAVGLLEDKLGRCHADSVAARALWAALMPRGDGDDDLSGSTDWDGFTDCQWGPIEDGVTLLGHPLKVLSAGRWNRVPVLIGLNRDDGTEFIDICRNGEDVNGYPTCNISRRVYNGLYRYFKNARQIANPNCFRDRLYRRWLALNWGDASVDGLFSLYNSTPGIAGGFSTNFWAAEQVVNDYLLACSERRATELMSSDASIFEYEFARTPTEEPFGKSPHENVTDGFGACHGCEIPFVFNRVDSAEFGISGKGERALGLAMASYWTNLAWSGDPNSGGARWSSSTSLPAHWPPRRPSPSVAGALLLLNASDAEAEVRVLPVDERGARCEAFWNPYFWRTGWFNVTAPLAAGDRAARPLRPARQQRQRQRRHHRQRQGQAQPPGRQHLWMWPRKRPPAPPRWTGELICSSGDGDDDEGSAVVELAGDDEHGAMLVV
mmetsp:Transcript_155125/g.497405  ORF Transcript_155125/g.497405 Transcript_155125/m.497405 type:complete len:1318 (+) Transcript_155125:31-3984(+)